MKKCKGCQMEIDSKAKICPHCRTKQGPGKVATIAGVIVLIVIVLGIIGAVSGGKSSTNSSSNNNTSAASSPTPAAKPMVVDASTLVGEYDKNKLAAQDKYTGKVVQTSAYIKNISGGGSDYYLSLEPTNDQYYFGTTIQCFFNDKSQLTSLSNGQQVTIQGTMQDMSIGIVEIKDCQVIK